jgi:membrane glycosyltransferase
MNSHPPCLFQAELPDTSRISRRRLGFFSAVFFLTALGSWFMADLFWQRGVTFVEITLFLLFVVLTAHISMGFCQALLGFWVLQRRFGDSQRISLSVDWDKNAPLASTAITLPIHNEDVTLVFERLRIIFQSVKDTGQLAHFDFFVLSDSNHPNKWIEEEVAWVELCKQIGGFGKIFYRKRRHPVNQKSGNISDFCRRWGKKYRHMVVLDADSIMTGPALVKLVQMMEQNPNAGIIQSAPSLVNGETLYARLQQFASCLYGPIFQAGMNYWQQGEGNFWGHNAIIRLAPFIEHCDLPDLPGSEPLGGRILSHDYVEAALMRKAGLSVWLAYDLEGSYEEGPPNLIENAMRDRRWCQGNLQHSWLLLARGFQTVSRVHLLMGILGYLCSPLWLLFLVFGTVHIFSKGIFYGITGQPSLLAKFSIWLQVRESFALFLFVMILLFLPKVLAVARLMGRDQAVHYGGRCKLALSALGEIVFSTLIAPLQMMFHSKFVLFALLGQSVSWGTQNRGSDQGTSWAAALSTHGTQTLIGLAWGGLTFRYFPHFFWWFSPVLAGLVFSIPVSVLLSRASWGRRLRAWGLLATPLENDPPPELKLLQDRVEAAHQRMKPLPELREDYGLLQAVLDPYINAVHVSILRQRTQTNEELQEYYAQLRRKLLAEGPSSLQLRDKMALLFDPDSMIWLHQQLWELPNDQLAEWWKLGIRQYNVLTQAPVGPLYR